MRIDQLFPGVAELRPDEVQAYLRSRGWSPMADPRDSAVVYASADGDEVVVPVVRALGDYARRFGELVETLAAVEKRPIQEVLEDLSLPSGDLLAFRVRSDLVISGTIPLLDAISIREAQKNLVLAAAHSVVEPRRYFPRMGRAEPMALLAACREAQTSRGSYITNLVVPVEPAIGRLPLEDPYGRRVTRLLMQTLSAVQQRLVRADGEGLLREPPRGLSYNFLAALAEMRPAGEQSSLDVSVRWSRGRAEPDAPARASFNAAQFETMRAVAVALREEAPATCEIEGYVARLSRQGDQPLAEGEVVVLTLLGEHAAEARVHLVLSAEDYRNRAMPAHAEGRRVRVSGVLKRDGRLWILAAPTGFEVLPGDEE